ncbi:MAG: hypothetical protein ACE10J_04925, partial [Thermodesulfobacteriota bacterium]
SSSCSSPRWPTRWCCWSSTWKSAQIAASNISYSCFSESNKSKCILTIRDYKLGDYNALQGFTLGDPIGTDYVIVAEEEVAQ